MSRILLIEDDRGTAHDLRGHLHAGGYDLCISNDATIASEVDLILLRAGRPGRWAFGVLERLRASGNTTPVILLSERAEEKDRIRWLRLGGDDCLSRAFGREELLARIRTRMRSARRVEILNHAITEASRNRDRRAALAGILDQSLHLTGAERGLVLLHRGRGRLVPAAARKWGGRDLPADTRYSTSVARRVLATGSAQALLDTRNGARWTGGSVVDLKLRHVLCAPVRAGGKRSGVLYADSRAHAQGFTRSDLDLFESLATECGTVIEKAYLRKACREKRRMERSLHAAREIQQALLPRGPVSGARVEVAGLNRPCEETGGDYFDYVPLRGDRLAVALGDVSGHGVSAALVMTAARSLLRAFLKREADPAAALAEVNRSLFRDMPASGFMSMFVGELDLSCGGLRYASAGHNDALLLRRATGVIEELEPTGTALGILEEDPYRLSEVRPIGEGDVLLLYSDGLTEARNPRRERFGVERLKDLLFGLRAKSAPEIVSGIAGASPPKGHLRCIPSAPGVLESTRDAGRAHSSGGLPRRGGGRHRLRGARPPARARDLPAGERGGRRAGTSEGGGPAPGGVAPPPVEKLAYFGDLRPG
ncbi:MAG: SpoIIE family protein phosphatase [Planctomycetota bacterium]